LHGEIGDELRRPFEQVHLEATDFARARVEKRLTVEASAAQ
jgi:hypothetical protein